jgi:hypothetical protein
MLEMSAIILHSVYWMCYFQVQIITKVLYGIYIDLKLLSIQTGGATRAMAYHCGVLRWLAENNELENISHFSSVSGGSLFSGLIFSLNNLNCPTSEQYLVSILTQLKKY